VITKLRQLHDLHAGRACPASHPGVSPTMSAQVMALPADNAKALPGRRTAPTPGGARPRRRQVGASAKPTVPPLVRLGRRGRCRTLRRTGPLLLRQRHRPGRPATVSGRSVSRSCSRRGSRSRSSDRSCAAPGPGPAHPSHGRCRSTFHAEELGWPVHAVRRRDRAACSIRPQPKTAYPRGTPAANDAVSSDNASPAPSCATWDEALSWWSSHRATASTRRLQAATACHGEVQRAAELLDA
jgi:hypothetical protein